MKKRSFALALCLLMVLFLTMPALAEVPHPYRPEDIDLSGVREVEGRLVGEVSLPKIASLPIKIDCPVPVGFTPEQSQRLTVEYQKITKKHLQQAMEGLGYDSKTGEFNEYINPSGPERYIRYQQEEGDIWVEAYIRDALEKEPDASGGPDGLALAGTRKRITALVEALGGAVHESLLHVRRYGEDLVWPYSTSGSTVSEKLKQLALKNFRKNRAEAAPKGDDICIAAGRYSLLGLPVMGDHYYFSGGDRFGASSAFSGVFRDDGALLQFQLEGLPMVKSAEALPLPQRSWEELLREWLAHRTFSFAQEQQTYQDDLFGEVTNYASYEVLIGLSPCWVGYEKTTLEPGFYGVSEIRMLEDDSLDSIFSEYTDALTLEKDLL